MGAICVAAPSMMSTCAFWLAENSVVSWLAMRAMSGPGTKSILMFVPNILFISACARAAPSTPASVELLQLRVSAPSLLASAISFLSASFCAGACASAGMQMLVMTATAASALRIEV